MRPCALTFSQNLARPAARACYVLIRARGERVEVKHLSNVPDLLLRQGETDQAVEDERHAALAYLDEAWNEAVYDGLDEDCLAQAALFTAIRSLVATYGEEAAAGFASRLADRIRAGEYTVPLNRQ